MENKIKKMSNAKIIALSTFSYQGNGFTKITGCCFSSYKKTYETEFSVGSRLYIKSRALKAVLESVVIKKIKINESDIFTKVQPATIYVDTFNRVWEQDELVDQQTAEDLVEMKINQFKESFSKLDACRRNIVYENLRSRLPNMF